MSADPSPVVLLEFPAADIALLRLNRPQARNALNDQVRQRLASHFQTLGADPAIRVIVLTGDSRCFAAGADLRDLSTSTAIGLYGRHGERYWEAIARCPKPVIAAVNGFALGGGCELAMHCDLIVAGESAQFAQPEIKVGVMPGAGGTQRLVRAVGKFQALRMLFTGCLVKAPQALAMGLVSEVVADESTLARALELATEIARLPPLAVAQIKEVVLAGADLPLNSALALERKAFQLLFDSQDQKEGMHAFLEKRPPNYQGK
ncbi:enoyl-CoA hydratase [Pseudomonas aeruginosa]|uniref:enoyl-CoA hydratase n=1 Tax=Pseudomonas aeruginosa TaxID=287 RepID=UPI00053DD705|nr:enoyl-CoA hydratase [Pseudomonas aeruginosa]MCO7650797.1 enoyl-CoA hydratase [Pseudomonas aeruginosa]MUJ06746.1 enoyl-CoA hydratase [Pseudomonas aeruginosa]PTZ13389.1 enoyl-CoA hydratase [Pseudomonas aeruginosa]HBO4952317.1 enoyl-CoA hydratase [Pseudomonas aeruginosa]HCU2067161.1 enoyl-CoA hydratase [Pseudomonas aeruginosa]